MTQAQLEAIKRHGERLLAIFPNATERDPVKLCKRLRRLETAAHAAAERDCNEPDTNGRNAAVYVSVEAGVEKLLGNGEGTDTPRVFINKDPRGYALKISAEYVKAHNLDIAKDWGGYGLIAPEFNREGF